MDCGYLEDVSRHIKLPVSAAFSSPLNSTMYVIWATRETGGGKCGHGSM